MTQTILEKILRKKKEEVALIKKDSSYLLTKEAQSQKKPSLKKQLESKHSLGIIAEIKRASPSKGMINEGVNPVVQAKLYEANGASAISVLTDEEGFKGTFNDLLEVRKAVDIPILCKDFIVDKIQIDFARAHGANVILLIASVLSYNLEIKFGCVKIYINPFFLIST